MEMDLLVVRKAEDLVRRAMKGNDASHDAAHAFRVRDLALSLAHEEGLSSSPDSILIVCPFFVFFFVLLLLALQKYKILARNSTCLAKVIVTNDKMPKPYETHQ